MPGGGALANGGEGNDTVSDTISNGDDPSGGYYGLASFDGDVTILASDILIT